MTSLRLGYLRGNREKKRSPVDAEVALASQCVRTEGRWWLLPADKGISARRACLRVSVLLDRYGIVLKQFKESIDGGFGRVHLVENDGGAGQGPSRLFYREFGRGTVCDAWCR